MRRGHLVREHSARLSQRDSRRNLASDAVNRTLRYWWLDVLASPRDASAARPALSSVAPRARFACSADSKCCWISVRTREAELAERPQVACFSQASKVGLSVVISFTPFLELKSLPLRPGATLRGLWPTFRGRFL